MSDTRLLPFPLYNSASVEAITDADISVISLPTFPIDPDEKTFVLLHVSANEYKRIASSIDIGSDIGYPSDSVGVWYDWVRATMSDTPCEIISNCILTNEGTRDAVADVFLNNNTPQYYDRLLEKLRDDMETSIVGPVGPDCNDALWGAIRNFIDIICDNATDFFEETEASAPSQILELTDVLANLPILDEIGLDALVDFVNWIVDQFAVYYAGSLTDEYKDALACEIFCVVKDTCQVTLDDCYNVLKDRVNPSFSIETLVDVMSNIADILITGSSDFVVDLWLFAMFRFAELGNIVFRATGLFNGADATIRLQQQLRLGLNNPDSDWTILCLDCVPVLKYDVPVYGRGYAINGGTEIVEHPVTDGYMTIPSVEIGDTVTVFNNAVLAIGDCSASYAITVTVTSITATAYITEKYNATTCASDGAWGVSDTVVNKQLNLFGVGQASFVIDA